MPPRPGDPDYLDWLISQTRGGTVPPPAVPTAAAPQPSGGRTSTPSATPTTTSARRDFDRENYNEKVAKGWPDYAFARDLEAQGYRDIGSGRYVNRAGDTYSRLTTPLQGVDPLYSHGFKASQADTAKAVQLGATLGGPAPTGPSMVPTPGALGGAFYPDPLSRAGLSAAGMTNLGRGLDTLRNSESFGANTRGLNQYDVMTRGGPGRAGFTGLIGGWSPRTGGGSPFEPFNRQSLFDSYLQMPEGYGGESGRDFYSQGEPSVATTFGGSPATLSTGTAGAEIRGGAVGGWGGDAGQILAAHGIEPSGDPLVDAGRAAEIAADFGAFNFQYGGEIGTDTSGGGYSYGDPGFGGRSGDPNQDYIYGGFSGPNVPSSPGGSGLDRMPTGTGGFTPVTTGTTPGTGFKGPLPPPQIPVPEAAPDTWMLPNVPRNGLRQRQQYAQNLFGYRRTAGGLPQMQALELAPGEIPTGPAPTGYFYLSPDYGAAIAGLKPQIAAIGETATSDSLVKAIGSLEENLSNLNIGGMTPEVATLQNQIQQLNAQIELAQQSLPGATLEQFTQLQQLKDQLASAQLNALASSGDPGLVEQAAAMRAQLSTLRDRYNRSRAREELQRQADLYAQYAAAPNQYTGGFAHGGTISVDPLVQQQANGRKSMLVPERSLIIGAQSGRPYGQMSERGAELLTDTGNSLRIDPLMSPTSAKMETMRRIVTAQMAAKKR